MSYKEVIGSLERKLEQAIAERDSERRWADHYAEEAHRVIHICENVHDRLLRGDSDKELMVLLEAAWKERVVIDRSSNPVADRAAHIVRGTVQHVVGGPK